MSFIEIADKSDFLNEKMKYFKLDNGKEILIINYEGSYYAVDAKCTHMKADLSKGSLEGKILTCPRHGSKFDITTGAAIQGPKMGFLKLSTKDLGVYKIEAEGEKLKIDI
jgi:3-phenylpropionate/trans-cinnamate dioxygenase ferredoxin subunit